MYMMNMEFELRTKSKYLSDEELLNDLKNVSRILKKDNISEKEYRENGRFTHKVFVKRFGSWNNAVKKAGLNIVVSKTISNEELFENLERIWARLGRQPAYSEITKPSSKFAVDTYCRRFGSWHLACDAFIRYKKGNEVKASFRSVKNKTEAKSRTISERTRLKVFKRDNYRCVICGKSPSTHKGIVLHIDHIVPYSRGGDNSIGNLRTLCQKCNLGKGDQDY